MKLRKTLSTHEALAHKFAAFEKHVKDHDEEIKVIFEAIRELMTPPKHPQRKIGFEVKEKCTLYGKKTSKNPERRQCHKEDR